MTCVTPSFTSAAGLPANISYIIRAGYAPGPDLTNEALTLQAVPDPVFATDGSAIVIFVGASEHEIGSGILLINVCVHLSMFCCGCSDEFVCSLYWLFRDHS